MIFNTNLEALASKIPPIVIIQHLESTGWKFFETKRKDIAVYQYTTDAVFGGIGRMSGRVNGPGERDED